MSLSSALYSSLSSLLTLQKQSQIASANVANAQSPDYSRKIVTLTTPTVQGLATGVQIQSIGRFVSQTLQTSLLSKTSDAAATAVQQTYLKQIGAATGANASTQALTQSLQAFQQAWTDFEANPSDTATARAVAVQGQSLAQQINSLAAAPAQIDKQVQSDIGQNVAQLNQLVQQAYSINSQIASQSATGQSTSDLQDRMDAVVLQMSKITGVQTLQSGSGTIQIMTSGGQTLVSAAAPATFSYDANSNQIQVTANGNTQSTPATSFQSGSLGALMGLRAGFETNAATSSASQSAMASSDPSQGAIRKFANQLDAIANQVAATVNGAYNLSGGYSGELAANFFTFSGLQAPSAATTATTVASGTASAATAAGGGLTDAGAAFGTLTATPTSYFVVTVKSGTGAGSSAVITGNTATSLTAPGLAATDATSVYEIQQVSGPLLNGNATAGTTGSLTDANNAWTANQFAPSGGVSYQVRITSGPNAGQIAKIASNTGNTLNVSPPFANAPTSADSYVIEPAYGSVPSAASMLQVNPALSGGATLPKAQAAGAVGQAMSSAASAIYDPIPLPTGTAALSNTGIAGGSMTLSNTISASMSYTAQGVASTQAFSTKAETARGDAESTYRGAVGVSVDQELSNMMVLQSQYQASAMVLQTVKTMFDTLINLGRN